MAEFSPSSDLVMHYRVDDFTDPWRNARTVLMLHGNAESGLAWYAWVPKLARQHRVVRPDMRGFGASTAMPRTISNAWARCAIFINASRNACARPASNSPR